MMIVKGTAMPCDRNSRCIVALSAARRTSSGGLRIRAPDFAIAEESPANGSSSGAARSRNVLTLSSPFLSAADAAGASPAPSAVIRIPRFMHSALISDMKSESCAQSQATARSIRFSMINLRNGITYDTEKVFRCQGRLVIQTVKWYIFTIMEGVGWRQNECGWGRRPFA